MLPAVGPTSGRTFDVTPNEARRFWMRVERGSGCWTWTGARNCQTGYGMAYVKSFRPGPVAAHRVAYRLVNGPIPPGMLVMHACDNPVCVKPAHLILGTVRDNSQDMIEKGRGSWQRRTTCRKGHLLPPFDPAAPRARRRCAVCEVETAAANRKRTNAKLSAGRMAARREALASFVAAHIAPFLPLSRAETVAILGERRSRALIESCGLFGAQPRRGDEIGRDLGVTRQRVQQLRISALRKLGGDPTVFRGWRLLPPVPPRVGRRQRRQVAA
jgi:hypothetical protein